MSNESSSKKGTLRRKKFWALFAALAALAGSIAVEPTTIVPAVEGALSAITNLGASNDADIGNAATPSAPVED